MFYRLFPFGSLCVLDRAWARAGAFVLACAACLVPFAATAAGFSVSPTNLAFGSAPLGATKTIVVTITNTSGVSQTPNFSGGAPLDPTNFGGSQNCAGVPLAAGGSCQFNYTFTPKTLGAKSSSTTIGINSDNFSITMSGTGISAFSVSPTNLVFGSVPVGVTKSIVVTITNVSGVSQTPNFSGGAPLDPTNFGGSQNCAGVPLSAGGSCKFTYTFTPASLGAKSSSTTIGINSENFSITMSGTGVSAFSVAPTNLVFGGVAVGATKTIAVTITNLSGTTQTPNFSGGAPLDPVNFGGSQNCAGVPLAPGASCKFSYDFHPTTVGAKSSSTTIGIDSDNFSITMSGTGTGANAISVAPTTIDFGSVPVGTASQTLTATVTNVSNAPLGPLTLVGGATSEPFFAVQNCQGKTLPAGGTCKFFYTFTPTAPGPASTSSNFTLNGQAFSVSLMGTGGNQQIAVVVEFYNASLDHYFITWVASEIADLDHGVHVGWQRTGKTFKTYTTPQPGTSPVCRFYIPPGLGDSHFFGRGATECNDTATKFPQLVLEDPAFMYMFLPTSGVCPPNTVEVHRAFSNRADANHRYTIELAVLNQMTALNWLAEGDGPNLVVMCSPP